jgi:RNA polymerase sigma-70 factor (ECF subfamily)
MLALPDRQRVAITMRHFQDCSNPEIASALDVSVEAVESLLSRGRKSLTRALQEVTEQNDEDTTEASRHVAGIGVRTTR